MDWISVTLPSRSNWREFIPFVDLRLEGHGRHGYSQVWIDKRTGARIETGSARDDMGHHITLTGDVLEAMRDDLGMIDDKLAERILAWDGKCSRIDLALDIFGTELGPSTLRTAIINGAAKMRARTWRFIEGHRENLTGDTIDTGSSASDVRLRFYDKRAEQGIKDGEAWVRLELQCRRMYARGTIGACAEHGVSVTASNSIGSYLRWSDTDYQAAIASDDSFTMTIPRGETKRRAWLLGQVAKALATEVAADPVFWMSFEAAVERFKEAILTQD